MADDADRREDVDDEQEDNGSPEVSEDVDQTGDGEQASQGSSDGADGADGAEGDAGDETADDSNGDDEAAAGERDAADDDGDADRDEGGKGKGKGKGKGGQGSKTQRGSGSPRPVPGGLDIVQHARAILTRATGRRPESVTGLQRDGDVWQVTLDVVELERIPSSSDVMAEYLIELTPDGELVGYRRINRFYRSQASNRDQV